MRTLRRIVNCNASDRPIIESNHVHVYMHIILQNEYIWENMYYNHAKSH